MHPNKWMPLYSQVTFSHIRYSDALKRGNEQRAIMDKIMALDNIESSGVIKHGSFLDVVETNVYKSKQLIQILDFLNMTHFRKIILEYFLVIFCF